MPANSQSQDCTTLFKQRADQVGHGLGDTKEVSDDLEVSDVAYRYMWLKWKDSTSCEALQYNVTCPTILEVYLSHRTYVSRYAALSHSRCGLAQDRHSPVL